MPLYEPILVTQTFSEPDENSAPQTTALSCQTKAPLVTINSRMEVKDIAGIDYGLGMERETERRQILRHQDAHARVINGEPSLKRVYCEHSGFW